MRIKRAPKKSPSTNAAIAAFILQLGTAPVDQLGTILEPIISRGWCWPRTDLQHWIVPLNRFDQLLEEIIMGYELGTMQHPQTNDFTPRTKELLTAILKFEKVLLENSTNRKIFASFDRLNDLLHTTDLSILLATLQLSLRPAQQFSAQGGATGGATFGISERRLLSLAQGWETREYGLEMVDLAGETIEIPAGLDEFEWQFYKKATVGGGKEVRGEGKDKDRVDAMDVETGPSTSAVGMAPTPSTPAPKLRATFATGSLLATPIPSTPSALTTSTPAEGLTAVSLGNLRLTDRNAANILVDAIETYDIPVPERLNLLQKIRIAKSLGSAEERRQMLVLRLLALSIFALTSTESTVQQKLFLYEPELIPQLAELVHPDRDVPIAIQAAAFYALDALAKIKSKLSEVASSLNASVSHGILMYVMRRTVADLSSENPVLSPDFIDALFNILTFFHTSAFVGNMIVGAGITSLLVDFVKNQRRDRVSVVTRAIVFLDGLMYGYSSAFTAFITYGGLAVFVDRVKDEIELCVAAHSDVASTSGALVDSPTGLLSFDQAALLKGLLRSIQRLMQTAGTTEGLRNLIDSSLLTSVKTIMDQRVIFGPQLFGLAINITATFVHNEPTCLTTIQEAKLPEALFDAIEDSIPASIDVLQAIPNAIGALCLNPAGLALFNTRPVIARYFAMFALPRHVRILTERDNANMIGASIDELIRHHPSLKDRVLAAAMRALEELRERGRATAPKANDEYGLQVVTGPISSAMEKKEDGGEVNVGEGENVTMGDVTPVVAVATDVSDDNASDEIMACIDVMGRFLEGLFQNMTHCKDFVKLDPFPVILDLLTLPCTPSIMGATQAFSSLAGLFRVLSEVKPADLVSAILAKLQVCLTDSSEMWKTFSTESRLVPLLKPTPESLAEDNKKFRSLSSLLTYIALLADIYSNLTYSHGKVATTVLAAISGPRESETLLDLGQLYRVCIWESVLLKQQPASGAITEDNPVVGVNPVVPDTPVVDGSVDLLTLAPAPASTPRAPNSKALQDVVCGIPLNILPLLQAATKLFVHRRSIDLAHRKASLEVSTTIATIMTENVRWPDSQDLAANLAYSTMMIGATANLLFIERSGSAGIQTLLLVALEKVGGITAFLSLYSRYQSVANNLLTSTPPVVNTPSTIKLSIVHVFAGLKIALELVERLSSHITLLESSQTALLVTREKVKTSPDYFDPNAFLVNLRAAILPPVTATWDVPWLRKSPPNVVRSIVATLINTLRAEGEVSAEPTATATNPTLRMLAGLGGALGGMVLPPPVATGPAVADETRIAQLMDMGFPRSAASSALLRCRNNLAIATEYLLSRPDMVGAARIADALAAPAEEVAAVVDAPAAAAAPVPVDAPADIVMEGVAPVAVPAEEPAAPAAPEPVVAAVQDVEMESAAAVDEQANEEASEAKDAANKLALTTLDAARDLLKPTFLSRAISLAEDYPDLVFDVKSAFSLFSPAGDGPTLQPILDDLDRVDGSATSDKEEQAIATRLRIIALLATDTTYRETIEKAREELMQILVRYAALYAASRPAKESRPKWLASVMLVADTLFSLGNAPTSTTILEEGVELPLLENTSQGPRWTDEREQFYQVAMHVLVAGISDRETFMSTLRLLFVLTRDESIARQFVEADGLKELFGSFTVERPETEGCRSYAVMILRHVIEEKSVLLPMMEREIEAWFAQPRAKVADMVSFLRGANATAFRNVPIFLEAAQATCKLVQADAAGHYHIALLNEPQPSLKAVELANTIKSPFEGDVAGDAPTEESTVVKPPPKVVSTLATPSASTDAAVHFLMTEILTTSKLAIAPSAVVVATKDGEPIAPSEPAPLATDAAMDAPAKAVVDTAAEVPMGDFFHTSFAMSCLTELLSSYSGCKTSFLTFSTKKASKEPSSGTPHKSKSSFLYFLLNDLLALGTLLPPHDFDSRRKASISTWASLIIVALCYDTESSHSSNKDTGSDIGPVRKTVLDAIAKAFKEIAASSETTDVRYGRLFALSDLCYRLLTARPYPSISKPSDETSMQLAKLMLEKNFAVILTNALADVDLNFPAVNNLINSILRPLEQLTKVVTKVGRSKTSLPSAGRPEDDDSTDGSSMDEGEEFEADTDEEEAPDLYRNSALGMYEGELEPGHQEDAYMSNGSTEEYDEDDDLMEMEDGVIPGSDISDASDDEEEASAFAEEMGMSDDEHDSDEDDEDESSGSEIEIDDEGNEVQLLDGFPGDDEDGEDGWMNAEDVDDGGIGEEEIDDAGFFDQPGAVPARDGNDIDSDGSGSEAEEMYFDEGDLEFQDEMDQQMFGQEGQGALEGQAGGFAWDPQGNGDAPRRNRTVVEEMMQLSSTDANIWGRAGSSAASMNTATHPLLLDSPSSDSRQGDSSLLRRRQYIANAARQTPEYTAWAQSIEQVIGTGAVEALQELLSSHGLAHLSGPDQIRLQVAPGPNGGIAMVIDSSPAALEAAQATGQAQQAQAQALPRQAGQGRGTGPVSAPRVVRHLTDRINSTTEFLPVTSAQRWQEESRVTQAAVSLARLTNHVINVLHAPARVRAKEDKIAEQLRDEAEFKRIEEKKNVLALAVEKAEQAERAAASMDVEPVVEGVAAAEPAPMEGVTDDITEVMNLARSLAAGAAAATPAHPSTSEDERDQEDDEQDDDDDDDEEEEYHDEEDQASGSGDVSTEARVTIFIHGEEVDITDTGIDPTFLEALPDDMREEVLNQHFRESRAAVPPAAVPSQINSEFLDALPPDLRAEVLRQEAAEQRREQASARGARVATDGPAAGDPPAGPSGVDPADFLATLAPGLRQAVEQEEVLLGNAQPGVDGTGLRLGGARIPAAAAIAPVPKKPAHREAIQLLDKSGLATLVRLLFFPQPLRKNALQKVLVNLCENSRTRMELINLLLAILQDGTRDVSAVDKSFSQMSLRANKALESKDTPRRKVAPETPGASAGAGGALPHFPGESVPNLIAHRCLEALMFLVSSNDQAPLFFLTEQETVVGLNRRSSKKGKGKEKAVPSTTYPIIVLLGLLDRPALLKTQAMMDSLTQLLSAITKALVILQKKPAEVGGATAVVPVVPAPAVPLLERSSTVAAEPVAEGEASSSAAAATALPDTSPSDVLLKDPPQIAPSVLRLVVNVLDAGECSSKTFQHTLVLIQNLSFLPEARETISDELKVRSEALSALLLPDLAELLVAIQSAEDVRGVTLAKFSPASSLQAKLLRILKTIDWIHSPPKKASTDLAADPTKLSDAEAKVSAIYESFSFVGLWQGLGSCLEGIEKKPELLYIATVLLPLIESLMVVSKYVGVQKAGDVSSPPPMSPSLGPPSTPMESMFLSFTDEHRKILNTMVRNNPALMSGSFAILVHNPKVLEFDNKRSYFFSRLHDRSQRQRSHYGTLQVNVRRQYVFEDSFHNLQRRTGEEIKNGKLNVKFYDEEGVDAGGVTREWFSVLARQMFNPGYALFQPQAADALTYQPNKSSSINPEHLSFFKFVGRIIGKALHDQRILEAYFSRSVYKHMLGKPVDHRDLESIDPEYHKSLVWMLENDIDGVLDLTFSVERDDFGVTEVVDLVPDGRNIVVTNENKVEYVRLIADQRLSADIKDQISALLKGLYEIVPKDLLQIFSERELELLISGLPEIDVDEWRANTDLHNFTATDPVIGYFWRAVRSFTLEERAKLLQFVSGSSRVPLEGFGSLQGMTGITRFSITSAGNTNGLPTAHTCFNQLDLPNFGDYEALRKALLTAITEGAGGFGFA